MLSGSILLSLGIIGIFMPVLPTTPFVIGAALCYSRSTTTIYYWLRRNRLFGPYIENYQTGIGIPLKNKIVGITTLWIMLFISVFMLDNPVLKGIIMTVGIVVTVHLLTIKTRQSNN
jgi:uncharacterized membrane protein YbaN (DUF454 family)